MLVTLAFTPEMGTAARRLKLVQVPGSGLNSIDRAALPRGAWLSPWAMDAEPPPA